MCPCHSHQSHAQHGLHSLLQFYIPLDKVRWCHVDLLVLVRSAWGSPACLGKIRNEIVAQEVISWIRYLSTGISCSCWYSCGCFWNCSKTVDLQNIRVQNYRILSLSFASFVSQKPCLNVCPWKLCASFHAVLPTSFWLFPQSPWQSCSFSTSSSGIHFSLCPSTDFMWRFSWSSLSYLHLPWHLKRSHFLWRFFPLLSYWKELIVIFCLHIGYR